MIQGAPVVFDREATIEKVRTLAAAAASQGARLAVFPEAFVSGVSQGARLRRARRGPDARRTQACSAGTSKAPWTYRVRRWMRSARLRASTALHLVIGVIERDGGTLYCTVLFFDPDGALMGKHRKLMPTAMERLVWGMGDGSTLPVFDTAIGKIGAVICWENYMPLLRTAMYAKGIQLYCAPTVDDRDTWARSMRHIAFEGRCFVLCAVQYLRRGDCPAEYPAIQGDDPATVLIRGGSVIVNPLGQVLAGPNYEGETMLTADLNLDEIVEGKYDLDVVGHYARPDVFRLTVNEGTHE